MQRLIFHAFLIACLSCSVAQAATPKAVVTTAISTSTNVAGEPQVLAVIFDLPEGLHAQSHEPLDADLIALNVKVASSPGITAGAAIYPPGTIENYPLLGKVSVYTGRVVVFVPLTVKPGLTGNMDLTFSVNYQMCDDKQCFLPARASTTLPLVEQEGVIVSHDDQSVFATLDRTLLTAASTQPSPTTKSATQSSTNVPPAESAFAPTSLLGAVAIALLVGVIFNVMPCVLPVLPLKAVGFYEAAQHDRSKTIGYGLLFAAGMITMFVLLACVVLLSKQFLGRQFQWGQQFSYPSFVWTMAAILAVLGFGMLGVFSVRLPTSVYGFNFRHDTLIGNFLWGGLTAILSTPCTAPLFPPLLAWAIGQPIVSGFIVMISVGVGMALPYVILSAFPELARKFPRTGPFAELVKQMMGFLLLGTAAWFAGIRLLGDPNQWWLVFAVVVIAGAYLVFRTRQILPTPRAISIAGLLTIVMISTGLAGTLKLTNIPRGWIDFTPAAVDTAKSGRQIVLVEFSASWCLNCKYIEQTVYHDPRVLDALAMKNVVTIKADLTDYNAPGWPLLNELGGTGIPFTAIYPVGGGAPITLESIYTADTLLKALEQATAGQ